jgi:hypothetical protein
MPVRLRRQIHDPYTLTKNRRRPYFKSTDYPSSSSSASLEKNAAFAVHVVHCASAGLFTRALGRWSGPATPWRPSAPRPRLPSSPSFVPGQACSRPLRGGPRLQRAWVLSSPRAPCRPIARLRCQPCSGGPSFRAGFRRQLLPRTRGSGEPVDKWFIAPPPSAGFARAHASIVVMISQPFAALHF